MKSSDKAGRKSEATVAARMAAPDLRKERKRFPFCVAARFHLASLFPRKRNFSFFKFFFLGEEFLEIQLSVKKRELYFFSSFPEMCGLDLLPMQTSKNFKLGFGFIEKKIRLPPPVMTVWPR
jgi:hypothetical protein